MRIDMIGKTLAALLLGTVVLIGGAQTGQTQTRPESLAPLVEEISPSVVSITTSSRIEGQLQPPGFVPEGSPFEDFFREFRDRNRNGERPRRATTLGSGFFISADGYVVTNNHVIAQADEILVELVSGESLPAKVVGTDRNTDIALLKIEAQTDVPFAEFGDSDDTRVGDWVLAIGNPLGQEFSVSIGIVSARNRALSGNYDDYIQTDAAINRGNSGGPLFDMDGKVIGVNTAILSPSGGSVGIGFSMASNVVSNVIDQLLEFGETRRGWLGVRIQDVTDEIAEAIGLDEAVGALIADVPEGPAKDAGLQPGDVITGFDGSDVESSRDLIRRVGSAPVGKTVPVKVFRDGSTMRFDVTLGRREEAEGTTSETPPEKSRTGTILGLTVSSLTDELREKYQFDPTDEGLVVLSVEEGSSAHAKGLLEGDLITEAGQRKATGTADLQTAIGEAREAGRKSLLLLVRRGEDPLFVALSIDDG